MKRLLFLMACLLACAQMGVWADKIPVALLSTNSGGNKTLTFTMMPDTTKTVTSGDGAYKLNENNESGRTKDPDWYDSGSEVDSVVFDPSFADARPTTLYYWFYNFTNLVSIKGIENLNTSEVVSTKDMFYWCNKLTNIDLSHFNLAKNTDMSYMFYGCSKLANVKFGDDLHTDRVKDFQRLFYGCSSLESLDLSKLNTTGATNVQYMFYNCSSLKSIDISNFDLAKVDTTDQSWRTGYAYMFATCTGLTSVNVGNNMFKGTTKNDRPFYRVGEEGSPVELKIGSKFDKSVLGPKTVNYYNWGGGYFKEPTVVKDQNLKPMAILSTNAGGNKTLTFTMMPDTTKTVTSGDGAYKLNENNGDKTKAPDWYANAYVDSVVFDPSFADARPTTLYRWFYNISKLVSIKGIENLNTSEVVSTKDMFYWCRNLTSIDLSHFNLAKNTDMSFMFYNCSKLANVKFGDDMHTDSVKDFQRLFYGCSSLESVDLTKLSTTGATNFQYMFYNCSSLKSIDISNFDLSKVDTTDQTKRTGFAYMFANCTGLTSVNVGNNMFKGTYRTDTPFYRVGEEGSPVELKIGPNFDKSVLGTKIGYYYKWQGGYFKEPIVATTAKYVDLGLSVKWGETNLGASAPEEKGNYYAWGETEPKESFSWANYKFGATDSTIAKYNKVDSLLTLQSADDAATVSLGGKWRMPTAEEFNELKEKCTWTQTTENGVEGVKITAANGNSIFLPFTGHYQSSNPTTLVSGVAGDYWTSSKYIGSNTNAVAKEFEKGNDGLWNFSWARSYGLAIRPVYDEKATVAPDTTETKTDSIYVVIVHTKADGNRTLRFTRVADGTESGVSGNDRMYTLPTGTTNPGWYMSTYDVDTVTIDPEFAGARPTTTRRWFYGLMNAKKIIGLKYLNTSESTSMNYMFYNCNVDSIDVSHFNTDKVTDMTDMFYGCNNVKSLDVSHFNTANVVDMRYMFYGCDSLKSLDVSHFNTANVADMRYMFYRCGSIDSLDLHSFNVEKVVDMSQMFYGCNNLKSLDLTSFKPLSVTSVRGMFSGLENLETLKLGEFSTPKATNMSQLFYRCSKLKEINVSKFNTESATDMSQMFSQCSSLTSLDLSHFNTSKVTKFNLMFYHCENLDSLNLKSFDTSNATDIRLMFNNCSKLKELDLSKFNTSKVTSMDQVFSNCTNLSKLEVGNFDTHLAPSFFQLFSNCTSLKTVDVSKWNTENVSSFSNMFLNCKSLQKLDVSKWNTSNATSFYQLFSNCGNLEELDVDSFDTHNVENFCAMFNGCVKLTKIDVSHFNTEKAITMFGMFYNCPNVEKLDLSSFRTPVLRDMGCMFTNCRKLTKLDISTFTTDSIITTTVPTGYYGTFNNCVGLKELNVGNNSFKGATSGDVVMSGVGTQQDPCLLIVGDQFDTSVLGTRLLGVYNWLGGYFNYTTATGINGVSVDGEGNGFDPNAPAYDLTGRRVNSTYRGVVIQNGKKYVRK